MRHAKRRTCVARVTIGVAAAALAAAHCTTVGVCASVASAASSAWASTSAVSMNSNTPWT